MKVLKRGTPQQWERKIKCSGLGSAEKPGCGAELLIEQNDLRRMNSGSGMDDSYQVDYVIVCPECSAITKVPNVPGYIWRTGTIRAL